MIRQKTPSHHYHPRAFFTSLLESSADAFIAELNHRRQQFRPGTALFWAIGVASIVAVANAAAAPWYIVILAAVIGASVLRHRENIERAIIITYDLEGEAAQRYAVLCSAFQSAASSAMSWRLATELALSEGRRYGGARKLITRTPTQIRFGGGAEIRTNVQPPVISLSSARLYFLPDKVIVLTGNMVSSISYRELRVSAQQDDFREDEAVPRDSTLVGTTWVYVNNNGTPDRRFNNNRQIPILAYSELTVQHPSLSFVLQFSKQRVADAVAAALRSAGRTPS